MTVCILFFIFHGIIYGPRVCNKHLNKQTINDAVHCFSLKAYEAYYKKIYYG